MEQTVTGCKDCPFAVSDNEWGTYYCQHPEHPKDDELYQHPITPDWCPLRTEPLTLKFQQQ